MAKITHICLSDLHAGAATSLITPVDPQTLQRQSRKISETAAAFMPALHEFLVQFGQSQNANGPSDPPQLVLLGDVLDLAFSDRGYASEVFVEFLTSLTGEKLFDDKLVVIPGNHDHSLWTGGRYAAEAQSVKNGKLNDQQLGLIEATPAFAASTEIPSPLIGAIAQRAGLSGQTDLRYPNYGLVNQDKSRGIVFHHGHFIETTYKAMSILADKLNNHPRTTMTAADLASENANWIDFGWSSFGDAANVGNDVTALYQYLLTGSEAQQLKNRASKVLEEMVSGSLPMGGQRQVQHIVRMVMKVLIDATFGAYSDAERYSQIEYLSASSLEGLNWYVREPVKRQMLDELTALPKNMTFVFGHTHKPFEDEIAVDGFELPVATCNTGGWMLDAPRLDGKEGASLVLVDDQLNTISIRMFQTRMDGAFQPGVARLISQHDASADEFMDQVNHALHQTQSLWDNLAEVAGKAYQFRQNLILEETHQDDIRADAAGAIL